MDTARRDFFKGLLGAILVVSTAPKSLLAPGSIADSIIYRPAMYVIWQRMDVVQLYASARIEDGLYDFSIFIEPEEYHADPRKWEETFRHRAEIAFRKASNRF
jgi:hypothetical protein